MMTIGVVPIKPNELKRRGRPQDPSQSELTTEVASGDQLLVRRAQSGEHRAFNALVRKYRHRVMKISIHYTRNRADAEDAVQETFIKAYYGLRHFRGESAFYSWLYRIAVNSAQSALSLRSRRARLFVSNHTNPNDLNDTSIALAHLDTPEELALTDEVCVALNASIDALCEEQRTAIVLREFQGLSYAQMASAMSCPIGTVRSRVSRAREAVDNHLQRVFDDGLGPGRNNRCARARQLLEVAAHA